MEEDAATLKAAFIQSMSPDEKKIFDMVEADERMKMWHHVECTNGFLAFQEKRRTEQAAKDKNEK
jgi:hypothetical protein